MKKCLTLFCFLTILVTGVVGCATPFTQKLNRLDLGMSQPQVRKILGEDFIAKASATDSSGARLQLWEYTDQKTQEPYKLYFKDGLLAQWGQHGKLEFPELNLPKTQ